MKEVFGGVALALSVGANIPYIIEIVQKKAKPERISWLLWTILGGVYFFSTVFDTGATLFTFGELIGPVIIFALSLKFGVGGKSRFDRLCLFIALTALILLFAVESVTLSLLLALFVDAIGIVLTVRKLRVDPYSESRTFWAMAFVSSIFALLSLTEYTLNALLFPVYVSIISLVIFVLCKPAKTKHAQEIEEL